MDTFNKYIYSPDEDIDNMISYTCIPIFIMLYYYINIDALPYSSKEFITKTYGLNFIISTVMMVFIYIVVFNLITRYVRKLIDRYGVIERGRIWICQMIFIGVLSYMFIEKSNINI